MSFHCDAYFSFVRLIRSPGIRKNMVGLTRLELVTSRLSGVRSNQLSYKPILIGGHLLSHAVSSIVPSAV